MASGNDIICMEDPKGVFMEGTIVGTPKPGTVMQISNVATVGGRFSWVPWGKATGAKGLVAVLLQDKLQGRVTTDAYVTGTRGFLYAPIAGEDLNMLIADIAGTTDDAVIGDLFGVETVTGKLKANSSYANPCFTLLESVTDPVADTLAWVKFNGH